MNKKNLKTHKETNILLFWWDDQYKKTWPKWNEDEGKVIQKNVCLLHKIHDRQKP